MRSYPTSLPASAKRSEPTSPHLAHMIGTRLVVTLETSFHVSQVVNDRSFRIVASWADVRGLEHCDVAARAEMIRPQARSRGLGARRGRSAFAGRARRHAIITAEEA